jgi:RHS repeat-associated protein
MSTKKAISVLPPLGCALALWLHTPSGARAYCTPAGHHSSPPPLIEVNSPASPAPLGYGPASKAIRGIGPVAKTDPLRSWPTCQDDETDLVYYGYRYHNVSTGRWLSRDPVEETGGLNLYAISGNDLPNRIDPLGLMTYDEVMTEIASLQDKWEVLSFPCCCGRPSGLKASLRSVSVKGPTVTVGVKTSTFGAGRFCPITILKYYWWNCFRAQKDGFAALGLPTGLNDERWKDYGWEPGGQTDTQTHTGKLLPGDYDSNHWNFQAIVVYRYCSEADDILRVRWVWAGQFMYQWRIRIWHGYANEYWDPI